MKIGVISDCHLGFEFGGERGEDSFIQMNEAFERSLDYDLILLPGDIFDSRNPRQEVLYRAIDIFLKGKKAKNNVRIIAGSKKIDRFEGIPVIAIHGTHERRAKEFVNPVQLLEKMNLVIYLHGDYVIFEKNGEKVAIHGMGAVPEIYAADMLRKFNFKPAEGCYNILMLHQSIEGFVYGDENIKISDLPEGFDLIINGHIHWHVPLKKEMRNLVIPGSTLSTQIRKIESEVPKGFLEIDTSLGEVKFHELESQRKIFYGQMNLHNLTGEECEAKINSFLESLGLEKFNPKPIVKIRTAGGKNLDILRKKWHEKAILLFDVSRDEKSFSAKGIEILEKRKSIQEIGMEILSRNLGSEDFGEKNLVELFEHLADGEIELGKKILLEENDNQNKN